MRFLLAIVLVLGLMAAGALEWAAAAWNEPGPPAVSGNQTVVLIAPRSKVPDIARQLQDAHVLNFALAFELNLYGRRLNDKIKAGEYAIPAHTSMAGIAAILVSGKSIQHKLTAAEGLTSAMIWKLVAADPVLVGDAGPEPAEGTLLPETYLFTRGTSRAQLLNRMHQAQEKFLAARWPGRDADLPYQSMAEAVILASIVEKETALPDERRHIAAVFVNRLRAGMKLQSDPTIIYGLTRGYPLGRAIRESEILAATPYNTYAIAGLPAAPICNPGKDALAAVLNPSPSNDLYFVATGQGGHVFAATVIQHNKNVLAYRAFEKRKEDPDMAPAASTSGAVGQIHKPRPAPARRRHV